MRTKRRKNPYIVFCKAKRDELKEKNKDMKPKEIQSKLAELWRALSEDEKEHAAKAIECGYLYREGDMLYTKILVSSWKERSSVFEFSWNFPEQCFEAEAERVAEKIAGFIKKTVPKHLFTEWDYVNTLADLPTIDALVEILIEKGLLVPPEDGIGAEGCWMFVEE